MLPHRSGSKDADDGGNGKRCLPSWSNSQKDGTFSSAKRKSHVENKASEGTPQKDSPFTRLLEGVVFALSGFVNPERGTLRSQALEMGAEFRPDWSPDCTLLVCAFRNTPKFKVVEDCSGTIVSKEWITECYNKKRLVEIDPYLMHAGNPWRKIVHSLEAKQENINHQSPQKQVTRTPSKSSLSAKSKAASAVEDIFPSSELKKWVVSDLSNTVSWLESKDEKPEPDEVKKIAVEGIITCLQDAVEALENNKGIRHTMDQWMFVPRVVEELAKLEDGENKIKPLTKKELIRLAVYSKGIYINDLSNLDTSPTNKKAKRASSNNTEAQDKHVLDDPGSDSDATIVMTEEEIDQAWRGL